MFFVFQKNCFSFPRLLCCGVCLTALLLGGCGASDSTESVSSDDLYDSFDFDNVDDTAYGSSLRETDSYGITIEYDKRFLEDDELETVVSYYLSIQNDDLSLFHASIADFYIDYCLETLYDSLLDESAYLVQLRETYQELVDSDDFTFTMISVTACTEEDITETDDSMADSEDDSTAESDTADSISTLREMYVVMEGQDAFDEQWENCKQLSLTLSVSDGETISLFDDIELYIVQLDGNYYICA